MPATSTTWFKVLKDGQSFNGSNYKWSMPQGDKPGEWQEIPATQSLKLCSTGFHLTDRPSEWWQNGCTIYVAEYEGEATEYQDDGCKIATRKRRLVRQATELDLILGKVFGTNTATVDTPAKFNLDKLAASGSATVRAYESATVRAYESATVRAYESATVRASGSATVRAYEYHSGKVIASGKVTVIKRSSRSVVELSENAIEIDWTSGKAVMRGAN